MKIEKIDPESRLVVLQELWTKCVKEIKSNDIVSVGGNGYVCINPSAKLLISLSKEIARLGRELKLEETTGKEMDWFNGTK
jgi:hypothetical protein